MVVIDDDDGPTSIAGVMGGARSEVDDGTTRVLMEAATWNGPNIQRTSTRLGLRSEASARFEKGLLARAGAGGAGRRDAADGRAVRRAAGRRARSTSAGPGPRRPTLRLREARVERAARRADPARRAGASILEPLGFGVAEADDGLDVTVPHLRRDDVTREVDLIEEVARIDGSRSCRPRCPRAAARPAG